MDLKKREYISKYNNKKNSVVTKEYKTPQPTVSQDDDFAGLDDLGDDMFLLTATNQIEAAMSEVHLYIAMVTSNPKEKTLLRTKTYCIIRADDDLVCGVVPSQHGDTDASIVLYSLQKAVTIYGDDDKNTNLILHCAYTDIASNINHAICDGAKKDSIEERFVESAAARGFTTAYKDTCRQVSLKGCSIVPINDGPNNSVNNFVKYSPAWWIRRAEGLAWAHAEIYIKFKVTCY